MKNSKFTKTAVSFSVLLLLAACGGDDAGNLEKQTKKIANGGEASAADFVKACTTYYTEATIEGAKNDYLLPRVKFYGPEKYCACTEKNIAPESAKAMGQVMNVADDVEFDASQASEATLAMIGKGRQSGVKFYAQSLAYERNPELKRPSFVDGVLLNTYRGNCAEPVNAAWKTR